MSPERLSQPGPEYLAQRHVQVYLEDALTQLLENRDEVEQQGSTAKFFAHYFTSVSKGTHILFREFGFVHITPHNRSSFLRIFWRCFRTIAKNGDLLSMKEYHCLLQILCPDFPEDLTQKAARIVLMDDAMDCLMSFSDFLYAFQVQFYYSEFLDSVSALYQDLLSGKNSNTVIVPTSRSATSRQRQPPNDSSSQDGVDALQFSQGLESLCERYRHSFPPVPLIGEILSSAPRITFYGFLMALAKHPGVNQSIGGLPDKADLLVDEVLDKELDRLISQLSTSSITHSPTSSCSLISRDIARVASPRKSLAMRRRPDLESDGSTEETDSSDS
ncbi:UPF0705 protein C11orf49 homolog [Xenopus laevis]|uniref:Centriolar satellite-associated tubulin polyglutamylase complex regulator 1 n=2 Tax=Xenopus laevis TaxID=8355 RepID=A0A974D1C2_XENLA|nr:UPF0705 protein C11orf49 homolog [Xenopus laevis]OCT83714.1 hypothetical protein XELAEV_18021855mg [Xenopus laevis]